MSNEIESVLSEDRRFPPAADFTAQANVPGEEAYQEMYRRSIEDPEGFWGEVGQQIPWMEPFQEVRDWSNPPFARWFVGGKLNASAVCLDQHADGERRDKVAILWEGEPGDTRSITYGELRDEVARFANVLKARGLRKGDRVAIYMPMIPELAMAVLACARIGAIHSVVFGGFSAQALRDRIDDGGLSLIHI